MATRLNIKYTSALLATILFAVLLAACGSANQAAQSGGANPTAAPAQSGAAASGEPILIGVSGPLTGLRGRVIRSASGRRFYVEVDFIGRGASVLCDGMTLLPIDSPDKP